jgi:uncharacterized protein
MKKTIVATLLLLGADGGAQATAASFDCAKARSNVEKSICGNPTLSGLDEEMAAAYKAALQTFPVKGYVKAEQRHWLSLLGAGCENECAAALIPKFSRRIEQLTPQAGTRVYANTRDFSYQDGDAVIQFVPEGTGRERMRVWGGFRVSRSAFAEPGKPVLIGCEFDGVVSGNTAADDHTTVAFRVSNDALAFTADPQICTGFARLPGALLRVQ